MVLKDEGCLKPPEYMVFNLWTRGLRLEILCGVAAWTVFFGGERGGGGIPFFPLNN